MSASKTTTELAAEEEAREDIWQLADVIEYLDTHDIGDELDAMPEVHFEFDLPPRDPHFAIERAVAAKLRKTAQQRGISAEALLNQWVPEKAAEGDAVSVGSGVTHEPARV